MRHFDLMLSACAGVLATLAGVVVTDSWPLAVFMLVGAVSNAITAVVLRERALGGKP